MLWTPVLGSAVTTNGSVMNGPPSSGQVVGIGSFVTSGSAMRTCWHAPLLTFLGAIDIPCKASGIPVHGARSIPPISGFIKPTILLPISDGSSTPKARLVRSYVPKRFIANGNSLIEPSANRGCSNKTAGPWDLTNLSAIVPASRWQSIGSLTLRSSPALSNASM